MTKFKLTDVQAHQVNVAHDNALKVCNELKRQQLNGEALQMMKHLEDCVSTLEVIIAVARQNHR